jgi:DNA repair protein RecO (recombination protein O)
VGRTFTSDCIVLKKHRVGETHKGLVVLSDSRGMLSAIAHGALRPGGRLTSGSEPLTLARVSFYHEPVKDSYKVTDLTVLSDYERVKREVARYLAASLWVEIVLRSLGGGVTDSSVFELLRGSLDELDRVPDAGVDHADLQFLWRFLGLAGFRPDVDVCASCGTRMAEEEPLFHVPQGRALVCEGCAARSGSACLEMSAASRHYLGHTLRLSASKAVLVTLARPAARSLRRLSGELLQSVLETRLRTLEVGAGIL